MKQTMTTILFGLCLLLASCSQEDTLNDMNRGGDLRQVTLGVTLPGGMTTRAGADEADPAVTRCYVQVLDKDGNQLPEYFSDVQKMTPNGDGSFSLTVALNPDEKYDFLFWADNADGNDLTDLTSVAYATDGKTIAYAAKLEDHGLSGGNISAVLTHVVTRINVKTTGSVAIDDRRPLTIAVPECYKTYNVSTMQPRDKITDFSYNGFHGTFDSGDHVGHFYVLSDKDMMEKLQLTYTADGNTYRETEVSNVPIRPNYSITLTGDIKNIGLQEVSFTATVDSKWGTDKEQNINVGFTIDGQGVYHVLNEQGLKNIAKLVNEEGNSGINITLEDDITLTGEWTPIGIDRNHQYTGTFDGNYNTITGLTVTGSNEYAGLFGYIGSGGTVQNVVLESVDINNNNPFGSVGGVAGCNEGTIENCSFSGNVYSTGLSNTGGITGYNKSEISGCSAKGTVGSTGTNVGGIAGTFSAGTIEGCHSTADVSGNNCVGGVVGNLGINCQLIASYSTGNVASTITAGSADTGGVVGNINQGTVTGCYHATGKISSSGTSVGGIVGYITSGTLTACYWSNILDNSIGTEIITPEKNEVEKVTDGDWRNARNEMNDALTSANSEWQYILNDEGLPELFVFQ